MDCTRRVCRADEEILRFPADGTNSPAAVPRQIRSSGRLPGDEAGDRRMAQSAYGPRAPGPCLCPWRPARLKFQEVRSPDCTRVHAGAFSLYTNSAPPPLASVMRMRPHELLDILV